MESPALPESALLDDEQMSRLLRDGYLVLDTPELDDAYHEALYEAACDIYDEARATGGGTLHLQVLGDNLRARLPLLERLLASNAVQGALTSVLGEGFVLHPHHFVHESTPIDQSFHQDGNLPWNDRAHYRSHRPNWAMLFYYPQPVTAASGPTEVLPGTQYWTTDFEKPDGTWHRGDAVDKTLRRDDLATDDLAARDRRLQSVVDLLGIEGVRRRRIELPRGRLVLAHYDLMHRGCRSEASFDARRFMYKFYYFRTCEPQRPSWRNAERRPLSGAEQGPLDGIVESIWQWLRGDSTPPVPAAAAQASGIECASAEDERVRLAYELGALARSDRSAQEQLGRLLQSGSESVRRAMSYAAGIAGEAVEAQILAGMASDRATVRRVATHAAGEARLVSHAAIEALFERLETDPDDLVRSNAAYSLGHVGRVANVSVARLLKRLAPGVEPNNSLNGGLPRSTVRVNVMYALHNVRLGAGDLDKVAEYGLVDEDRYVSGLAVALLERRAAASGERWLHRLVGHLARHRFNHPPPKAAVANRTDARPASLPRT